MKKILPYFIVTLAFGILLYFKYPQIFQYKFNQNLIHDYLRSQDINDPQGKIKDRIFISDSDIYIASGYLYATGSDPTTYNFQHPPLIKYLFGFSILLTGNPFYVQILFGLALLFLTYFLGTKLFRSQLVGYLGILGMLTDPVFGGMMKMAFLDLGQAVFALGYVILIFFFPESFVLQGVVLGLFAASKFWSTAILFVALVFIYKILIRKKKVDWKKTGISILIAFIILCLTYAKSFVDSHGFFNIFFFLAKDLKFMLAHNSAGTVGGSIILFFTGFFAPWWQEGVLRAGDWSFLWPVGLVVGIVGAFREFRKKIKGNKLFFYLLPFVYLILESTQVPFTRYFIIILPFVYLNLVELFFNRFYHKKWRKQ